jgi:hypothetical protein
VITPSLSRWSRPFVLASLAAAAVAACAHTDAGNAPPPPPASAEPSAKTEDFSAPSTPPTKVGLDTKPRDDRAAEAQKATSSTTTTPATPTTTLPQSVPSPEPDAPAGRAASLRAARSEVERAQRELDLAMNDCASACRALGSMERATGHLCDLASEADDRQRCEDAKSAVRRAREKIRGTCRACPNGPSLDKSAPIPSRP